MKYKVGGKRMKYKVGDIVILRSDIEVNEVYGSYCFLEDMCEFKGKKLTIAYVFEDSYLIASCYLIREDVRLWDWTDEMFEEVGEE